MDRLHVLTFIAFHLSLYPADRRLKQNNQQEITENFLHQ